MSKGHKFPSFQRPGPSGPHLDPWESSLSKGGPELGMWPGDHFVTLSIFPAGQQRKSLLRVPIDTMPPRRPWGQTWSQPSVAGATWLHVGSCPLPQGIGHCSPIPGERWLPACPMTAKAPRLCFLEDCIWTSIILINPPNKKFLKQKFQYSEAQGGDVAVLKTRHWRLWIALSGLLLSSSGFLMVWPWARDLTSFCFNFLTCFCFKEDIN